LAPTVGIAVTGFGIRAGSFNFFIDKISKFFIDKISKFFIDKISKFFIDKISEFCDCRQQQQCRIVSGQLIFIIKNSSADQLHAASTARGSGQKFRRSRAIYKMESPGRFFFGRFAGLQLKSVELHGRGKEYKPSWSQRKNIA
jgi:hypothetical protein